MLGAMALGGGEFISCVILWVDVLVELLTLVELLVFTLVLFEFTSDVDRLV